MKLSDCLLTPCDLYPAEDESTFRLAIMGTCVAEHMVNAGALKGLSVDHYLLETWINIPIPAIHTVNLDGIIIHLTLRHILDMAAGVGIGDVSYINSNIEELSRQATHIMMERIDAIAQHFAGAKPLFFLSFIEPPQTTKGFFHNNRADSIYRLVRNLNDAMAQHLSKCPSAYYIEVNDILSYYGSGDSADSYHQHFTHAGNFGTEQSDNFYLAILQRVINALETLRASHPVKVIITDLDNTLWNGVPAEEDEVIPWAHMEGWPIGYAEALLECKRRGILLAVSSKNSENETINNFRKIWGDKIYTEDFVSMKINWNAKSDNIREILEELNLLPSNALFIDDNPLEIEEVRRAFPDIRTLSLPQKRWRNVLLHAPHLQTSIMTEESKNKTTLLKAKLERDKIASNMDRDDYLRSLELQVRIAAIRDKNHLHFSRTLELLNKTNQFNTTGQRWSDEDISAFLAQDRSVIYTASVEDRLANHGLTAVAIVSGSKILQFVLSCRIFGLGIETALLHKIMISMQLKEGDSIIAYSKDTGRNASSRNFYSENGFTLQETDYYGTQKWITNYIAAKPSWIRIINS